MSSSTVPPDASATAASAASWIRVEYEGYNNTLAVAHLYAGQRVRVEVVEASASSSTEPLSTEESLARTAKATVRYIGPVAAARDPTAVMVGVEWDEGSLRGRNDGSVGGVRYFTCPPKSGSFIHPARLLLGEPASLLKAIESKYETRFKADAAVAASLYLVAENNHKATTATTVGCDTCVSPTPAPSSVPAAVARHIPVVFQGEEYMQNKIAASLAELRDMTLMQAHVSRAVEPDDLAPADPAASRVPPTAEQCATITRKIPRCDTLDLTDNLVRDWKEAGLICRALPSLTLLALSTNNMIYNTLFDVANPASSAVDPIPSPSLLPPLQSAFANLTVLVLNTVPDAWPSVLALALRGALPALGELHLCKNSLAALAPAVRAELQVGDSAADISAAAMAATLARAFPKLHTLELSHNSLSSWEEVRLLQRLPRLHTLLLNNNAITSVEYEATAPVAEAKHDDGDSADAAAAAASLLPFGSLTSLGLNNNVLASFASVDALSRFPLLSEVRLQANAPLEALTMSFNAAGSGLAFAGSGGAVDDDAFQTAIRQALSVVREDEAHKLVNSAGEAGLEGVTASSVPAAKVREGPGSSSATTSIAFAPSAQSAALLRLQLIGRLPRLVALNRSRIKPRERIDAEKYYLLVCYQAFMRLAEADRPAGGPAALFPRYTELVAEHGDPADTVNALQRQLVEPQGSTLASKLVEVTLVHAEPMADGQAPDAAPAPAAAAGASVLSSLPGVRVLGSVHKKISSSLTVQATRMMLDKTFRVAAHLKPRYTLQWREDATQPPNAAHPLDEPLKSLNYFGVTNGAILVLLRNK